MNEKVSEKTPTARIQGPPKQLRIAAGGKSMREKKETKIERQREKKRERQREVKMEEGERRTNRKENNVL